MSNLKKTKNLLKKINMNKQLAIDMLVSNPNITHKEVCSRLNINKNSISEWRKDPKFVDALYEKYQVKFNYNLIRVQEALLREALEGNVQACKLIFEIAGKIVKRINIKIQAPFQQWLDAKDAEIVDIEKEIPNVGYTPMEIIKTIKVDEESLPKRNKRNDKPLKRSIKEKKRVNKIKNSERAIKKRKKQYSSWYHLRTRAKKVGLELLPPRKPTKTQRANWLSKLKELEKGK